MWLILAVAVFAVALVFSMLGQVPVMVLLLGVPMEVAVGSSAVMVGLTASGGFAGHLLRGHWNWELSLILAVAAFIGGQMGSRVTVGLDRRSLKAGFGWFLIVVAATMVLELVR
jgi:uncharacterized membrane protein YfcA